MKVLFISVGQGSQGSLGIEALSAILKRDGNEVDLAFNPGLEKFRGFIHIKFFERFNNDDWYLDKIKSFKPDLICFSCLIDVYSEICENARTIKKHFNIPIVIGGAHPTVLPEYVMQNTDFDMCCIGEGDEALRDLVKKINNKEDIYETKNFWFRRNGDIIKNEIRPLVEDLDCLPFPDRDLFIKYGCFSGTLYFITGRGCPFSCSYCCHHIMQRMYKGLGRYVRRRSVKNVIDEIKICMDKYRIKSLLFLDDLFTIDTEWIQKFSDEYKKACGIPMSCLARPGTLNREIVSALVKANCTRIYYGIDSGSPFIRTKIMNRNFENDVIFSDAMLLREYGIKLSTSAIFCFPEETDKHMFETIELVKKINADELYTFIYYPFPNTDSFNYCVNNGYLDDGLVERIKKGEGGIRKSSMIKSKYADLAMVLKNVSPLYIRYPIFKTFLEFVIRKRMITISTIIFFLAAPVIYKSYGRNTMRDFYAMAKVAIKWRLKKIINRD